MERRGKTGTVADNNKNHNDDTRKLLELMNEFGKVPGYKIKIQKSAAFLYTNNKVSERKIKETIPYTIGSKQYPKTWE